MCDPTPGGQCDIPGVEGRKVLDVDTEQHTHLKAESGVPARMRGVDPNGCGRFVG